jgi:hypothetical protein
MGLFDSLLSGVGGDTRLTPHEAYAGILVAATACDGHFADDEVSSVVSSLTRMKLFQRLNEKQFGGMLDKLVGIIKRSGVPALVKRCLESLPPDLKDTAFANACNIVLADGVAEEAEKQFINDLQQQLGIDVNTGKAIVQVMVIKNLG